MDYCEVVVPDDDAGSLEPLGTKEKFWYHREGDEILFKEGRKGTGEDWAEVAVSRICQLMNIPHAHYDFAVYKSRRGVVSKSIVPQSGRLILGNELLERITPNYGAEKGYRQVEYTISRTNALLARLQKVHATSPLGWEYSIADCKSVTGLFTGFLLLDVLVGNQDRHHENWGFILTEDKSLYLAPTFDHGSSLGRNESDEKRHELLTTKNVRGNIESYASRAKSAFRGSGVDSKKRLKTIEAFTFFAKKYPKAAEGWLNGLDNITETSVMHIFEKMPRITQKAVEFATKLVLINKQRLLASRGRR